MKRKIMIMLLAFVTLTFSAFSLKTYAYSGKYDVDYDMVSNAYQLLGESAVDEYIENELSKLEKYTFDKGSLVDVHFEDDKLIYEYKFEFIKENVYVATQYSSDNSYIIEIAEGNSKDVIEIKNDHSIMLNGHNIVKDVATPKVNDISTYRGWTYVYSTTPRIGVFSDYNTLTSSRMKVDLNFETTIVKLTTKAIAITIKTYFGIPSNSPIDTAIDVMADSIKTGAQINAPNSTRLFYDQYEYKNTKHSITGINEYYMYKLVYYNWNGSYVVVDGSPFYYYNTWIMS